MKKYLRIFSVCFGLVAVFQPVFAQNTSTVSKSEIEYETVSDDPYDLHKLWLHLFPMYADGFATNFNVGYGAQADYRLKNKVDFRLHARKTYTKGSDFSRGIGERSTTVDNKLNIYKHFEGGATYHLMDKEDAGETKIIVYTKRYKASKWASTIPEYILVPSKSRKITGVRLGGYYWESATNLGDVLRRQKVDPMAADGSTLGLYDYQGVDSVQVNRKIYGNVKSAGIYLGGSLSTIRNVVVKPKKYDAAVKDLLFNAYADILYAPMVRVENVMQDKIVYEVSPLKTKSLGFRAGIEGVFNREFSWSYGGEIGYKPSIQSRGFYAMVKVGVAFASRMQQQRQSYQRQMN